MKKFEKINKFVKKRKRLEDNQTVGQTHRTIFETNQTVCQKKTKVDQTSKQNCQQIKK